MATANRPKHNMLRLCVALLAVLIVSVVLVAVFKGSSGKNSSILTRAIRPATPQLQIKCSESKSSDHQPEVHQNKSSGFSKNGFIPNGQIENKCCDAVQGRPLEEICYYTDVDRPIKRRKENDQLAGCSCADYLFCKLVIVTSASSNHMTEVMKMIALAYKHLPNTKIIMNNLGLTEREIEVLNALPNVEVRLFNFDKYPGLAYCKGNLFGYGWKPMVVKEAADEYEVIMYFDPSVRLNGTIDAEILKHLLKYPGYIPGPWFGTSCYNTNLPIISYTHDDMLRYLFPIKSKNMAALRKELAPMGHFPSGCYIIWFTKEMKKKVLDNWVDCGLHQECMAPKGTDRLGCKADNKHNYTADGAYLGCHRYDQSSLDLIMYRELEGQKYADVVCNQFVFDLFPIERW